MTVCRRSFLRGAGGAAIALPLLPATRRAHSVPVPRRLFTLFHGNGLPIEHAAGGVGVGPLAPLAPFASRLVQVRGIDGVSARMGAGHQHAAGGAAFAVGRASTSVDGSAGPSLDVAAARAARAGTPIEALSVALYHWDVDPVRHVHSWRGPDLPNLPVRRPLALFEQLFGAGAADARRRRARSSVLDAVIESYRRAVGPASGHGPAERAVIAEHLETLRALERRAQALEARAGSCAPPPRPPDLDPDGVCSGDGCPPEQPGTASWDEVWATHIALVAAALRCDLCRHGSLTCTAAGDRYNLPFLDTMVHVLAHAFRPDDQGGFVLAVRWVMDRVAAFLRALDDPSRPDPDGGTLLDRTLVLVGTELADPVTHGFDGMSYLIAGGGVRGGAVDARGTSTDVDLYRAVARAAGVVAPFGDERLARRPLPDLL